jgi:hypothetical protein
MDLSFFLNSNNLQSSGVVDRGLGLGPVLVIFGNPLGFARQIGYHLSIRING